MAKKKIEKGTTPKDMKTSRFSNFIKSETTHFVVGLISVIFAVYLLLAFTSFFFTGDADQSILDNQLPGELMQTNNQVKNYAGARGAQLAEYLINNCFGIAAYFIVLFLAVLGMRMMRAYKFRIWKWFMSCSILMIWFSITLGFSFNGMFSGSFIYPGGLHGYNVSNWIISQIGVTGLWLLLFVSAILFFVYLSKETINVVRKALHPEIKRNKKEQNSPKVEEKIEQETIQTEVPVYTDPEPTEVIFDIKEEVKPQKNEKYPPFEDVQEDEPVDVQTPAENSEENEPDEPTFTIASEHSEEDEAYKGPKLAPYNPRLDLENYRFPSLN